MSCENYFVKMQNLNVIRNEEGADEDFTDRGREERALSEMLKRKKNQLMFKVLFISREKGNPDDLLASQ